LKVRSVVSVLLSAVVAAACGGGGGGGDPVVDGGVVKGPVLGATVCAFAVTNRAKGAPLTVTANAGASGRVVNNCYVTGADGAYSFRVPGGSGEVLLEATGGQYCTDELPVANGACLAGGTLVTMTETMTAAARVGAGRAAVYVTPLTTAAVNNAAANGGLTVDAFEGAFATLAGQVIGNPNVKPSDPPSAQTQSYLTKVADHMKNGGTLNSAVSGLQKGTTTFTAGGGGTGGIPADGVAATINAALVGQYSLRFHREPECDALGAACPYPDGQVIIVRVHSDGRLELPAGKVLTTPFHRKLYGGPSPHLPEIIWRDSFGIEFALSDNEGGKFHEINVGDGNHPVMPAGYPTYLGQLRLAR
jgi:hypothetical protein